MNPLVQQYYDLDDLLYEAEDSQALTFQKSERETFKTGQRFVAVIINPDSTRFGEKIIVDKDKDFVNGWRERDQALLYFTNELSFRMLLKE